MPLFVPNGGDKDDYRPVIDLANTIEQGNNPQPQNANQMINGNGEVVNYNQDPLSISKK